MYFLYVCGEPDISVVVPGSHEKVVLIKFQEDMTRKPLVKVEIVDKVIFHNS